MRRAAPPSEARDISPPCRRRLVQKKVYLWQFRLQDDGTGRGLEITSAPLGPYFPDGMLVAMNSSSRNFILVRWRDIAAASASALRSRPATAPQP